MIKTALQINPERDCTLCPRLKDFRDQNREKFPDKWNAPVPAFGSLDSELLIVGLAPGLKGANFSARPFTGDYAGDLLYPTLIKTGFAKGNYGAHIDDGLIMTNARITNAVRCVPPQNKPTTTETKNCLPFLKAEIKAMPNLKVILALGGISHKACLQTLGYKQSAFKFAHNALYDVVCDETQHAFKLINSYHCSRYNTNTGRLTEEMFMDVFKTIKKALP